MNDLDNDNTEKTKEERMVEFAKALTAIDEAIQPYREHKSALKEHYKDENWLSKEEMTLVAKALRMLKNDECIEDIVETFNVLKTNHM